MRVCVLVLKKLGGGMIGKEELCFPIGPVIPIGGYIDPPDFPEQWRFMLNGEALPISSDLPTLSAISLLASRLQDDHLREAIHGGLQSASEIATAALPENMSVGLAGPEEVLSHGPSSG